MENEITTPKTHRPGNWLPSNQEHLEDWLEEMTQMVEARRVPAPFHPVIKEFEDLIEHNPLVRMYMEQMIAQVPHTKKYRRHHLKSVSQMLCLINRVLTQAPEYNDTALVGAPLNAIIDWCMGTRAGFAAFRDETINAMFRNILYAWCEFLSSEASLYVLNDSPKGWKCDSAQQAINIDQFQYDPDDEYWGFKSWNDFFIRKFKNGQRPIAEPDNNKVIVSACESAPYKISNHVKKYDKFWLKSQPYSLQDMLTGDESVDQFVGGTVYQAFLSAFNYHRWHSPITGTITKAFVKEGTYYSEADVEGEDPAGPNNSQGYITQVATRAIILIECDDPVIGLMCFIAVGMAEISSCIIDPKIQPGYHIQKGEELGYFQYGGSTHCLIFRPGVIKEFALCAIPDPNIHEPPLVLLGQEIAVAN